MWLRSSVCLVLVLALGLLFAGCGNRPDPTPSAVDTSPGDVSDTPATPTTPAVAPAAPEIDPDREVAALVNGYPAYRDEVQGVKNSILNQYAQAYAQFGMDISMLLAGSDGHVFELGIEAEALMQVVQMVLTQQEADRRGIAITDAMVQEEFDSQFADFLAAYGWTEDDLALFLAEDGRTIDTFKAEAMEYVADQLLAMAVQKAVAGPLEITDEQLNEYFIENKANYDVVEKIRASHILVDTLEEAEEIMAALSAGGDFAQLARERSIDTGTGARGGDLDWFERGRMVTAFEDAVFALAVGELSGIVETEYGFHIILLTDRTEPSVAELADVIDQVRADLEDELSYEAAVAWYEETYDSAEISIHDPLLNATVQQRENLDLAIEILEAEMTAGTSEDAYLPYVLGTFYETKMTDAIDERTTTEDEETVGRLTSLIDEVGAKALAAFGKAQEAFPDDPTIQSKLTQIEALLQPADD
jgi:foldase protein PrsA